MNKVLRISMQLSNTVHGVMIRNFSTTTLALAFKILLIKIGMFARDMIEESSEPSEKTNAQMFVLLIAARFQLIAQFVQNNANFIRELCGDEI